LLRPKVPGASEVLPRPAIALLGAGAAWMLGASRLMPLARLVTREGWPGEEWWMAGAAAAVVGGAVGWLVGGYLNRLLGWAFRRVNAGVGYATGLYTRAGGVGLRVGVIVLLVYGELLFLTYKGFSETPKGFIPTQDMGYLLINVQLPDSASAERTREVMDRLEVISRKAPGVKHTQIIAGQSFLLSAFGSNFGSMFV